MRIQKKDKRVVLIVGLFLSLSSLAENLPENGSCAETFQTSGIKQNKKRRFDGIHVSIRDWIKGLTPDEIVSFIPTESRIKLNERGISSPKMYKILSKLRDRINLDHGALFVVTDSLNVIDDQLHKLVNSVHREPVLVRHAFNQFILNNRGFESSEFSHDEKQRFKQVLFDYKMALKDPEYIHNKMIKERLMQVEGDPKQAIIAGSVLNQAIQYKAKQYMSLFNLIRIRRDECVNVFAEIAQRHFTTEEVLMTALVDNISRLNKHLEAHDLALNNFKNLLDEQPGTLNFELQSLDLKKVSITFQRWLSVHIKGNDQIDYGNKLMSASPERFFSIQDRARLDDADELKKRWDVGRDGFNSVQEYLLKILNSDKVFFVDSTHSS